MSTAGRSPPEAEGDAARCGGGAGTGTAEVRFRLPEADVEAEGSLCDGEPGDDMTG